MKAEAEWEARARELTSSAPSDWCKLLTVDAALQLGREMADERAEEIARRIVDGLLPGHPDSYVDAAARAASIARSTISKPKTRDQVLEEALREIASKPFDPFSPERAREALEWKP